MNGILLVNHFLRNEKFNTLHTHLTSSAESLGIELELKTNLELANEDVNADFVLFWDKDINLARRLEKQGIPVFNSADSIEKCDDKARTYIELNGIVSQPQTIIAPKTYFPVDMREFVESSVSRLSLPVVFKECFGSFGEQVFLCHSVDEVMSHITEKPFILQEFIKESFGNDIRIEVVSNKVVSAVRRYNKNDFRSNVTNGGVMEKYTPTNEQCITAIKACEALGLTFAGVDILNNGMVCEVNSNAHIINIMKAQGTDIALIIFKAIMEKLK